MEDRHEERANRDHGYDRGRGRDRYDDDDALDADNAALDGSDLEPAPARIRFVNVDEDDDEGDRESLDAMLQIYEDSMKEIREGQIVRGTVLRVGESEVLVDVGFKSEGVISLSEFPEPINIKVGDEIDVYLEKLENQDGLVVLSKQRADFLKVWSRIKEAYDDNNVVEGRLVRRIKGGVVVDLFGVEAFLPGSQVALRQVPNLDDLIGHVYPFKIIKLNKRRRNIVVSRRVVLEEERNQKKEKLIKELEKGQIREGVVKNITDFGAFVDLGGIDGLLHITDMSWGRIGHPSEVVGIGDTIQVKVLEFDREKERISLGLKQLTPYPWEDVENRYPVNTRVDGRVVSITDYGAFVELEKGIEGLIHVSEMSWTRHIRHPSKILNVGDTVEAVVLKVDREAEKISLGLKQTEPDPWLTIEQRYPVGSKLSGKVRNLTNFGAFVEVEEGIDGLVHISDMSWTKRIKHANEIVKKGEDVEVMVLNIDKENRRISLGLKQVQDDPWEHMAVRLPEGSTIDAPITKVLDKGVVVDVGNDVEGFVPLSQITDNLTRDKDALQPDEILQLRVVRLDLANRRIVLSVKAYLEQEERDELAGYHRRQHQSAKTTIADLVDLSEAANAAPTDQEEEGDSA
ncbi:MAG: 30S ribosomal protein S1 [Candidatus Eisenbacteria bacterium]|nr:30S ribosomal protein S1 [Candidatus Eisenbacteria bacterium]